MDKPWIKHGRGSSAQRVKNGKNDLHGNNGKKIKMKQKATDCFDNEQTMKNLVYSEI